MAVKVGDVYYELTVIKDTGKRTNNRNKIFLCRCSCKNEIEVPSGSLVTGNTKSCGCLGARQSKERGKENRVLNKYILTGEYGIGYTAKGEPFYFDLEDFDLIKEYTWRYSDQGYVISTPFGKHLRMHILIMNPPKGMDVDHIKGIRHDNRKSELRICEHKNNLMNTKDYSSNTSGRKGVSWDKNRNKWMAYIKANKKNISLGRFEKFEDAVKAREEAELKYFGEYVPQPILNESKLKKHKDYTAHTYNFENGIGSGIIKERDTTKILATFYFDKEDFEKVKPYVWKVSNLGLIYTKLEDGSLLYLHKLISKYDIVEFQNKELSDCRKTNLIGLTKEITIESTKGVSKNKKTNKYICVLTVNGKRHSLGNYDCEKDAIIMRKEAELYHKK